MAAQNRRYFATRRKAEEAIKEHHSNTDFKVYHIKKGRGRRNGFPFWIGSHIEWLNRY